MKHSKNWYFYLSRTVKHLDDFDLAALYLETQLNGFEEWFLALLSEELVQRPNGIDSLLELEIALYKKGELEVGCTLHMAVLKNFCERGDLRDVVCTLAKNGNLENAIKIVAAGCEWLPEEEINDETVDLTARIFKAQLGID